MNAASRYRGRFAPSPTGPLHFGSLVAAVASYLDAKHHHGTWLVRMEDLDTPRCIAEAADSILRTLAAFGLHSDEAVLYQSQRSSAYDEALQYLQTINAVYPCCCTRREIADSAMHGIEGLVYPGTCRDSIPAGHGSNACRLRTDYHYRHSRTGGNDEAQGVAGVVAFDDAVQGHIKQNLETEIGDFVVKRADGLFAYQLAVVVDDALQGITNVVRGADLLISTPRQIYLQRLLGLTTPAYMHLPVAVNEAGEKLSKQTLAAPVNTSNTVATMCRILEFLQQQPPDDLLKCNTSTVLNWAVQNWNTTKFSGIQTFPASVVPAKAGIQRV